ncbi:IbrB-like domain-containing protein [Vibrio sp. TBV020]|uniref:IbrB-like domain-containing protein n=1 Tax=Vibrio sp. TBV020 TaxID=3137398 RepID=UPI0038CDC10F
MGWLKELESLLTSIDIDSMAIDERVQLYNSLSDFTSRLAPFSHPILNVQLVDTCLVKNNDYNPNKVAPPEFKLLRHSILKDGLTMPVVTARQPGSNELVIIDGYHRSHLMQNDTKISGIAEGYMPVVVLDKSLDERMSSSVRHNMARGAHQVELTAQLVMKLKKLSLSNEEIGRELGMDNDEVLRMQQVTGLAQAFEDNKFSSAWE